MYPSNNLPTTNYNAAGAFNVSNGIFSFPSGLSGGTYMIAIWNPNVNIVSGWTSGGLPTASFASPTSYVNCQVNPLLANGRSGSTWFTSPNALSQTTSTTTYTTFYITVLSNNAYFTLPIYQVTTAGTSTMSVQLTGAQAYIQCCQVSN